jgi:transcriptional regulator with XRE-family HTH domain
VVYSTRVLCHLRAAIGHNIHRVRVQRKLLLGKLASASGVSADRIDRYEMGKNEIQLDELLRIACALDVQIAALLEDGGPAYMSSRKTWDDFFMRGPHVSEDFMTDRDQPPLQPRKGF